MSFKVEQADGQENSSTRLNKLSHRLAELRGRKLRLEKEPVTPQQTPIKKLFSKFTFDPDFTRFSPKLKRKAKVQPPLTTTVTSALINNLPREIKSCILDFLNFTDILHVQQLMTEWKQFVTFYLGNKALEISHLNSNASSIDEAEKIYKQKVKELYQTYPKELIEIIGINRLLNAPLINSVLPENFYTTRIHSAKLFISITSKDFGDANILRLTDPCFNNRPVLAFRCLDRHENKEIIYTIFPITKPRQLDLKQWKGKLVFEDRKFHISNYNYLRRLIHNEPCGLLTYAKGEQQETERVLASGVSRLSLWPIKT